MLGRGGTATVFEARDTAASAPTPGGVMQVRLSNAAPKPQTIDLKTHYRTVSYHLVRAVDGFAKIITEVKAYSPEKNLSRLATRMSALDPSVLPDLEAKQKDFLALINGPARLLMADPVTGHLTREELEPIHVAIKDLAAWAAKGVNLPLFMKNSNDLNSQIQMPLKLARSGLPDLDALTAPRMTAQGFAKLSEDDRVSLIENAEKHGYKKEDLGDDSAKVHALIGDAGIDAVFAHVQELAESEQEQSSDDEDDLEIGAPSLAALYVVKSGNEILGYQLETHINCQPSHRHYWRAHGDAGRNPLRRIPSVDRWCRGGSRHTLQDEMVSSSVRRWSSSTNGFSARHLNRSLKRPNRRFRGGWDVVLRWRPGRTPRIEGNV